MSAHHSEPPDPYRRITAVLVFLIIGVPPGLCSLYFTDVAWPALREFRSDDLIFVLPWLLGLACATFAAVPMIRAWLPPRHRGNR